MYFNGRWGRVCNDGWNDKYASMVCAQMGLGSLGELADFGPGTGSYFLEKVMCPVNATILASCGHYGVGITVQCNHNQYRDVGVKCNDMFLSYIYVSLNFYNNLGRKATTQQILPSSSQEFSSLLPRYHLLILLIFK